MVGVERRDRREAPDRPGEHDDAAHRCTRLAAGKNAAPAPGADADHDQHRARHERVRIGSGETRAMVTPTPRTATSAAEPGPSAAAGAARARCVDVADGLDDVEPGDPHARQQRWSAIEIAKPTTKPVSTVDQSNVNVRWSAMTSRPDARIWSARHDDQPAERRCRAAAPSDAGGNRVEPALLASAADEERPAHPHRPEHAELGAAFVGEHDEHVDEQEDAGRDREHADGEVELRQRIAGLVGTIEQVLLDRPRPRRERPRAGGRSRRPRMIVPRAPSSTPPTLENASDRLRRLGGDTRRRGAASPAMVPGATNTLYDCWRASIVQKPGDPRPRQDPVDGQRHVSTAGERRGSASRRVDAELVGEVVVTAAVPAAGVRPEMPVAVGSPPNRRALAKSTSSSCARGCVPPPPPGRTTAAPASTSSSSTPSTGGAERPCKRPVTVGAVRERARTRSRRSVRAGRRRAARIDRLMVSPTISEPGDDRGAEQRAADHEQRLDRPAERMLRVARRRSSGQPRQHRPRTGPTAPRRAGAPPRQRSRGRRSVGAVGDDRGRRACGSSARPGRRPSGSWVTSTSVSPVAVQLVHQLHHVVRHSPSRARRSARRPTRSGVGRRAHGRSSPAAARHRRARWDDGRCDGPGRPARASRCARRRASRVCTPASSSGISTFSTALSTGIRLNAWNTKPIDDGPIARPLGVAQLVQRPRRRARPDRRRCRRARRGS